MQFVTKTTVIHGQEVQVKVYNEGATNAPNKTRAPKEIKIDVKALPAKLRKFVV